MEVRIAAARLLQEHHDKTIRAEKALSKATSNSEDNSSSDNSSSDDSVKAKAESKPAMKLLDISSEDDSEDAKESDDSMVDYDDVV